MIEFIGDGKIEGTIKISISKITNVNWINNVITSGQLNIEHENGVHTKLNFRDGQVDESIVFSLMELLITIMNLMVKYYLKVPLNIHIQMDQCMKEPGKMENLEMEK